MGSVLIFLFVLEGLALAHIGRLLYLSRLRVTELDTEKRATAKYVADVLLRYDKLVDTIVAFKKDGFQVKPAQPAAVLKEDLFAGMPRSLQELLGKYPAEFRSTTLRWIREQRSHGAEWEAIEAHVRGDGQGWRGRPTPTPPTT